MLLQVVRHGGAALSADQRWQLMIYMIYYTFLDDDTDVIIRYRGDKGDHLHSKRWILSLEYIQQFMGLFLLRCDNDNCEKGVDKVT